MIPLFVPIAMAYSKFAFTLAFGVIPVLFCCVAVTPIRSALARALVRLPPLFRGMAIAFPLDAVAGAARVIVHRDICCK